MPMLKRFACHNRTIRSHAFEARRKRRYCDNACREQAYRRRTDIDVAMDHIVHGVLDTLNGYTQHEFGRAMAREYAHKPVPRNLIERGHIKQRRGRSRRELVWVAGHSNWWADDGRLLLARPTIDEADRRIAMLKTIPSIRNNRSRITRRQFDLSPSPAAAL